MDFVRLLVTHTENPTATSQYAVADLSRKFHDIFFTVFHTVITVV